MSNLSEYISKNKEYVEKNNFTELEKIRYVYLDLGQRLSFNLNFSFGNREKQKEIYNRAKSNNFVEEDFKNNNGICNSMSYMLEKILTELGVNIRTVTAPLDERYCAHTYNVVTSQDGEEYIIDLQEDLENIQSHSFTKNFGRSTEKDKLPPITRMDIEKVDKKLGAIKDDFYYADEYLHLIKTVSDSIKEIDQKAEFVFENLEAYDAPKMEYAERKWHHEKLLKELFSEKELKKIHQIDCYRKTPEGREYQNCIVVELSGKTDIYLFSKEESRYKKISMEEFAKEKENGLVNMEGILGLKKVLRDRKEQEQKQTER